MIEYIIDIVQLLLWAWAVYVWIRPKRIRLSRYVEGLPKDIEGKVFDVSEIERDRLIKSLCASNNLKVRQTGEGKFEVIGSLDGKAPL